MGDASPGTVAQFSPGTVAHLKCNPSASTITPTSQSFSVGQTGQHTGAMTNCNNISSFSIFHSSLSILKIKNVAY